MYCQIIITISSPEEGKEQHHGYFRIYSYIRYYQPNYR